MLDGPYGGNPLWLAEWLCEDVQLQAGMKVLDLGCGRANSSVFLANEFGVHVSAVDLWLPAEENQQRVDQQISKLGIERRIECHRAEASRLPFEFGQFDAILAFDSIQYYGTGALFLPYIVQFLKPHGILGFASAGVTQEVTFPVPRHLERLWQPDAWSLRTASWWREHWVRTGLVDVQIADAMDDGWTYWLDWSKANGSAEWGLETLRQDAGEYLCYIRTIARRSDTSPDMTYDLRTGKRVG